MLKFCENPNLIVEIYKHISPVFIWIENMEGTLRPNDPFKEEDFFQLLKEIRNDASHLNIYQNEKNEMLFIKFVMIYKMLGLNLIDESRSVQLIWNRLHNDNYKRNRLNKLKSELDDIELDYYGKYEENLNLFKSFLFSIFHPTENNRNQYQINLINIIFQYISPIIIWYEEMKDSNESDWKFLDLLKEIKNRVCHLSNIYGNDENLEEILKSLLAVYMIFDVDLKCYHSNIKEIDFGPIQLCIEYKENEIKEERNEILRSGRNNTRVKSYESFRKLIDLLVVNEDGDLVKDQIVSNEINDSDEYDIDGLKISNTKSIWDYIRNFIPCLKF